jgi:hypothetical protein
MSFPRPYRQAPRSSRQSETNTETTLDRHATYIVAAYIAGAVPPGNQRRPTTAPCERPRSASMPCSRTVRSDEPADGHQRSGLLTTVTAPAIWDAAAGTRVRVWLTSSGEPTTPPPSPAALLASTVAITVAVACAAGIALLLSYWLCRLVLDRRRLAAWESAWTLTGPRWTTLR